MTDGRVVLDASALMALVYNEPGSEIVRSVLTDAVVSAVNWSELAAKLVERGFAPDIISVILNGIDVEIYPFDAAQALSAGMMRRNTRAFGLSLGDRACLALTQKLQAVAYTADKIWAQLKVDGVAVKLIR